MALPKIAPYPMPTVDDLPAGRLSWDLDASRAVLLVHDLQEHFLGAFDRTASPIPQLLDAVGRLREAAASADVPVIFSAQPGGQDRTQRGLLQDLWGDGVESGRPERIVDALAPRPDERVLTKWRYSAFVRTELLADLRAEGRDQLMICGIYAHIGCLMTAVHAFMEDVQPFLVADALADFCAEDHRMAIEYASKRCAVVRTTAQVVAALTPATSTATWLRAQLSDVVEEPLDEVADSDDLLDVGLDSLRLMDLVAGWRRAGVEVTFEELAERPTIDDWVALVDARRRAAAVA